MLNFNVVKQKFEEQIYDILRYEIYYSKDDAIFNNLVCRFKNYLSLHWNSCDIDWSIQRCSSHLINILIQFNDDPCFGFEFCIDLNLLKHIKLGID